MYDERLIIVLNTYVRHTILSRWLCIQITSYEPCLSECYGSDSSLILFRLKVLRVTSFYSFYKNQTFNVLCSNLYQSYGLFLLEPDLMYIFVCCLCFIMHLLGVISSSTFLSIVFEFANVHVYTGFLLCLIQTRFL